jgi:hypothetical protein
LEIEAVIEELGHWAVVGVALMDQVTSFGILFDTLSSARRNRTSFANLCGP